MVELPAWLPPALAAARHVAVLTGAGVSAESGVPTFRGPDGGLWGRYRLEDLATVDGFLRNPRLVWEWYAERRAQCRLVEPNPGHHALVAMEQRLPALTLLTQNIDNLHQRAGSRRVVELHGNLERVKCYDDDEVVDDWAEQDEVPPRCPRCGGRLRPDVVWFGELLPPRELAAAEQAALRCDLFLTVGTSATVHPAAALPLLALQRGVPVVELNLEETALSDQVTCSLRGLAGELLPRLVAAAWGA